MSTHKHIDRICVVITVLALVLTLLFMNGEALGLEAVSRSMAYEGSLFDSSRVHTIDIVIDDWDAFLDTAMSEEYASCSLVIDNNAVKNVAIRGKGNTSLSTVSSMGSERYSFKIEFDHYQSGKTYKGLDKLCLNNLIQDNTYMKDYLAYRLMDEFGADAPLCSYVWVTVNGEDWGLYLAVEAVEGSFMERVYNGEGELYKPDSLSMGGGGPGNGKGFDLEDFLNENGDQMGLPWAKSSEDPDAQDSTEASDGSGGFPFGDGEMPEMPDGVSGATADAPESTEAERSGETSGKTGRKGAGRTDGERPGGFGGGDFGGGMGMGSGDVKLQYQGDDPDSYSNIFDNAKTTVSDADRNRLIRSLKALSEGADLEEVLDIDELLRYFVVHNYLVNSDSYTGSMVHNYYLHEEDGRLRMIPWDYNLAFGTFQGGDAESAVNDPIDSPLSASGDGSRPMADWIFQTEEYTELYHQYFAEFLEQIDIQALIDETCSLIAPYVEKDPTAFCSYEEFETGVQTLKSFCEKRTESVLGQLDGTIPSTDAGQQADSSSLIDASGLNLSDMGSMGGGRGGGFGGGFSGFGGGSFGGSSSSAESSSSADDAQASDTEGSAQMPDMQGGDFQPPDMGDSGNSQPPDMGNGSFQPPDMGDGSFQPPDMGNGGNFQPPDMGDGSGFQMPDMQGGDSQMPKIDGGNFQPPGSDGSSSQRPGSEGSSSQRPGSGGFQRPGSSSQGSSETGDQTQSSPFGGAPPDGTAPFSTQTGGTGVSWLVILISAGALAIGLLAAFLYKKRS